MKLRIIFVLTVILTFSLTSCASLIVVYGLGKATESTNSAAIKQEMVEIEQESRWQKINDISEAWKYKSVNDLIFDWGNPSQLIKSTKDSSIIFYQKIDTKAIIEGGNSKTEFNQPNNSLYTTKEKEIIKTEENKTLVSITAENEKITAIKYDGYLGHLESIMKEPKNFTNSNEYNEKIELLNKKEKEYEDKRKKEEPIGKVIAYSALGEVIIDVVIIVLLIL